MKVKCIDDTGSASGYLIKDKVYEVEGVSDDRYTLVGVPSPHGYWYGRRFEKVIESQDYAINSVDKPSGKVSTVPDDGMRFFKAVRDGYCACNMPKAACQYHR